MNTPNTVNMLSELHRSLDQLKTETVIPITAGSPAPVLNRPRRKPRENKQIEPRGRGRPPESPIDPRINNPEFAEDIRALRDKYGFRSTKEFLMRAREATKTRMRFEMTKEKRDRMYALFSNGKKPREVAARMGCSTAHANMVRRQMAEDLRRSA